MRNIFTILIIIIFSTKFSYAYEEKYLVCEDTLIDPEKMAITDFKNNFFPKEDGTLTISYQDKITKIWSDFTMLIQFTLRDSGSSYNFQFPKNFDDASSPNHLNLKEKTFDDHNTGDTYKFISGSLNKLTLKGNIYYLRVGPDKLHPFSKTRDYLRVHFKCEIKKPKI